MATILGNKPRKVCPSCKCFFEFDVSDIKSENEQYWAGFWKAWQWRTTRYVECPGCGKPIIL